MDSLHKLINSTEKWLEFMPKFPKKVSTWLAKYLWAFTILGVLSMALASMGLVLALSNPDLFKLDVSYAYGLRYVVIVTSTIVQTIVLLYAVSLLRKSKKLGWDYLFLAVVVNAVASIASELFTKESPFEAGWNIVGHVVSYLFSAYLLFQTRSHFVKK